MSKDEVEISVRMNDNTWLSEQQCVGSSRGANRTGFYLFEGELKLGRVQQQLEEHAGLVLGVRHHLVLDLTQTLVVDVVG